MTVDEYNKYEEIKLKYEVLEAENENVYKWLWFNSLRDKKITLDQFTKSDSVATPSYWITSLGFFFGYAASNIVDMFKHPSSDGASDVNKERRHM
jgi:hypothetical protein